MARLTVFQHRVINEGCVCMYFIGPSSELSNDKYMGLIEINEGAASVERQMLFYVP